MRFEEYWINGSFQFHVFDLSFTTVFQNCFSRQVVKKIIIST